MKKIVINNDFGGFGLSHAATMRYAELKGIKLYPFVAEGYGISPLKIYEPEVDPEWKLIFYYTSPNAKDDEDAEGFYDRNLARDDPLLIQVVEEMKEKASGRHAHLKIVEIPDNVDWEIEEYDGAEWVSEKHQTWN